MQALQRRVCGESGGTLQSDSTRLTILPADQQQLAESEGEDGVSSLR